MKLWRRRKLDGYAPDLYHEHAYSVGRKVVPCYHYDVAEPGRVLEAMRRGAKPIDTETEGLGCNREDP